MHIVVDIDGVIADTAGAALERLNLRDGTDWRHHDIKGWNHKLGYTDIGKEIISVLRVDAGLHCVKPIFGAADALWYLKKYFANLWITIATSRQNDNNGIMRQNTFLWLRKYLITYDVLMFADASNKGLIDADIIIDDNPISVVEFSRSGRPGLLFDQPWNWEFEASPPITRVHSWDDIILFLKDYALDIANSDTGGIDAR